MVVGHKRGAGVHTVVPLFVDIDARLAELKKHHDARALWKSADAIRGIWSAANAYLVEAAPWSHLKSDPVRAAVGIRTAVGLVALSAAFSWPIIPTTAQKVWHAIGHDGSPEWPSSARDALWLAEDHLSKDVVAPHLLTRRTEIPEVLFEKLTPEWVDEQRIKFGGGLR